MTNQHSHYLILLILALTSAASAQWNEQVLYSFQGGSDGYTPTGGIVFDKAGNLYGATTDGGADNCSPIANCGTVFQLAPPANDGDPWTETVLYVFKGAQFGDGDLPAGGLVIDSQGNLYGTTAYGGTGNCLLIGSPGGGCGTVYELSPPAQKGGTWTETILYSFPTAVQGYLPQGDLVFDGKGNLYGATDFGGGYGTSCNPYYQYCGAIFELSPPQQKGGAWTEKVLHGFRGTGGECCGGPTAGETAAGDGTNPNGGLVFDSAGNLYGTTYQGGIALRACQFDGGAGCGTVFELSPPKVPGGAWTESVLHRFVVSDGGEPQAGVILDNQGYLYGTTFLGGPRGAGTVFELAPSRLPGGAWIETLLHYFSPTTDGGAYPEGSLAFDGASNLLGTDNDYGAFFAGTVFQVSLPSARGNVWSYNVLYNFNPAPDAAYPVGDLILNAGGDIFGTTELGGSGTLCQGGCGAIFELTPLY